MANLYDTIARTFKALTYTEVIRARVGNGEDPSTVIVPINERTEPGMLWCYTEDEFGLRDKFQALNTSSDLTGTNDDADTPVLVGKPPGSNKYSIISTDPERTLIVTGGYLPSQAMAVQNSFVYTNKFAAMRMQKSGTWTVSITGGWVRFGDSLILAIPNQTWIDTLSYKPPAGENIWISVFMDNDQNPVIIVGDTYDASSTKPASFMPTSIIEDTLHIGWINIWGDASELFPYNIVNEALVFEAYEPSSGNGTGTGNQEQFGCKVANSADISIPASTTTILPCSNEIYDTNAFHDIAISPERITIPQSGIYTVKANVKLDATDASERLLRLILNNSITIGEHGINLHGNTETWYTICVDFFFNDGDYIFLDFYQDSLSAIDVLSVDFSIHLLGLGEAPIPDEGLYLINDIGESLLNTSGEFLVITSQVAGLSLVNDIGQLVINDNGETLEV